MADRSGRTNRVNTPVVFNHNQMLKEIRDNLKHLRRERENEGQQNGGTQVVYHGGNTNSQQHQHVNNHQVRFSAQRNNFAEPPSRGHHEHMPGQGNRTYDESGYSSSSSECSSQSANDFNGQQLVGNVEVSEILLLFSLYKTYVCLNCELMIIVCQTCMQKYFHVFL